MHVDAFDRWALAGAIALLLATYDAPDGFYGKSLPEAAVMPLIRSQPRAQAVDEGATARFDVTVEAPGPVRYQWRRNGVDLPGATQATLVVPATAGDDHALYSVIVRTALAGVASRPAELRVAAAPAAPRAASAQPGCPR